MRATEKAKNKIVIQKGFSLVELMVSVAIFAIAMIISISTLLVVIDANAKAQATSAAMTNVSYSFDNITRNLRTGKKYYCTNSMATPPNLKSASVDPQDCNPGDSIAFIREVDGEIVAYRKNGSIIEQNDPTVSSVWLPITGSDVIIDEFRLFVNGSTRGDTKQPEVRILIDGHINNGLDTDTDFKLQTHVIQRIIDL